MVLLAVLLFFCFCSLLVVMLKTTCHVFYSQNIPLLSSKYLSHCRLDVQRGGGLSVRCRGGRGYTRLVVENYGVLHECR